MTRTISFFSLLAPQPIQLRIGIFFGIALLLLRIFRRISGAFSFLLLCRLLSVRSGADRIAVLVYRVAVLIHIFNDLGRINRIAVRVHRIAVFIHIFDDFFVAVQIIFVAEARRILRLRFTLDINLVSGKSCSQPRILSFPADRKRKLIIRYNDLRALFLGICKNRNDLGRRQRVLNQVAGVLIPGNDINLLAAKLLDNRIDAAAVETDAGADRINAGICARDSDLGSSAGFSSALLPHAARLNTITAISIKAAMLIHFLIISTPL